MRLREGATEMRTIALGTVTDFLSFQMGAEENGGRQRERGSN